MRCEDVWTGGASFEPVAGFCKHEHETSFFVNLKNLLTCRITTNFAKRYYIIEWLAFANMMQVSRGYYIPVADAEVAVVLPGLFCRRTEIRSHYCCVRKKWRHFCVYRGIKLN